MMKFRIVKGALTFKNTHLQHRSKASYRVMAEKPNCNQISKRIHTDIHTHNQSQCQSQSQSHSASARKTLHIQCFLFFCCNWIVTM